MADEYMVMLEKLLKNQEEILENLVSIDDKMDDLTEVVNNLNLDTEGFQREGD